MTVVQRTVHQTVKTDTQTAVKQVNVVEDCIRSIMVFELKEEDEEIWGRMHKIETPTNF